MSLTVSNCYEICNSPLNSSTAKNLYSFPKDKRFRDEVKLTCDRIYELPPVREKRSAALGYGNKYDFTKQKNASPPPGSYNIRRAPSEDGRHWSFGLSRDSVVGGPMNITGKQQPGPGAYDIKTSLSTVSFSMRPRTNDPNAFTTSKSVPGPGSYPIIPAISKGGKHFYSKYKDSGATTFNPPKSKRFNEENPTKTVPGPGAYDFHATIDSKGTYFNSKFNSSACRTFSHEKRTTFETKPAPGPGAYRLPSEFGHYESKYAKEMDAAQKPKENAGAGAEPEAKTLQ
eukprot:TRINITY_DN270_c0_g2_i1.p1 TRINITY_DN270_c0_g2~~TRINITY_DN270_c0_g2_i1.p1  ORF type:complete len:286 (-),score=49.84 TRINITY_DN270_c0_g2_i1:118-975(-)